MSRVQYNVTKTHQYPKGFKLIFHSSHLAQNVPNCLHHFWRTRRLSSDGLALGSRELECGRRASNALDTYPTHGQNTARTGMRSWPWTPCSWLLAWHRNGTLDSGGISKQPADETPVMRPAAPARTGACARPSWVSEGRRCIRCPTSIYCRDYTPLGFVWGSGLPRSSLPPSQS